MEVMQLACSSTVGLARQNKRNKWIKIGIHRWCIAHWHLMHTIVEPCCDPNDELRNAIGFQHIMRKMRGNVLHVYVGILNRKDRWFLLKLLTHLAF